jgi:arylsulfatase A-like enzyme
MAESPNILWIVTTQWRAQAFGFAGDVNARTPHLDRLAAESVNYSQAVTPHPFGPFARAAMLTGRLSPANGVADYFDPLPIEARTIAHELGDRCYQTAFFGKWHLGERDQNAALVGEAHAKVVVPAERRGGFEFWEGFESGFLLNDPWLHGSRLSAPREFKGYQSDVLCDRASEFISEWSSSRASESMRAAPSSVGATTTLTPWFMVVSLESPHPPYDAPSADVVPYDPQNLVLRSNVPRGGDVEAKARAELVGYYAHIEATDRAIGRLLEAVNREDTIVVFTSVHGDMHGSHGSFRKGWPYEESVRVPLLVRHPRGEAMARGENQRAISLANLPEMTGGWAVGRMPSPEIEYSSISMPSVVALPHQCDRVWRGIRTPDRKLILNESGEPWLFFDLNRDPFEMNNLVNDASRAVEISELSSHIRMDEH